MKKNLLTIYEGLCSCAVFYRVMEKPVFKAYEQYCQAETTKAKRKAYTLFVAEIYEQGGNLTVLTERLVSEDENTYIKGIAAKRSVDENIQKSVLHCHTIVCKLI